MVQTPCPQNEAIDEPALIEGLEQGRTWACNALVFNYQDRLLKIAYGITLDHEESREIVQDVFVSAMGSIKNFRGESGLGSWLRKITLNACLNWKRKWKRRFKWHHTSLGPETEFLTYDKAFQGHTPETELKAKQEQMRLVQAVQALPEPLRVVFVLSTLEGLSYQQISAELKIKEGTVSSRLYRARKTIVNGLKANEKEVFHGSLR
ncbi:MAG: RNA polymerase sigma factor [Desulfobacter sp.]|nr:RNA polymerase sigma factor [Desulfobacter sp.]WDP88158.1 MAG: RNA polymerase sigma factor [Desulfobacter sp.]